MLAASAQQALAGEDIVAVTLGEGFPDGSKRRSSVVRAAAQPRSGGPLRVVIKTPVERHEGFVRERVALSLIREHRLPAAVRLLGASDEPPMLVMDDLGDGPSVADLLLNHDPIAAGSAIQDWATAVATLQAASAGLGDEFRARLAVGASPSSSGRASAVATTSTISSGAAAPMNWLMDWLSDLAEGLAPLLEPLGVRSTPAAVSELRSLAAHTAARATDDVLVPGDTCPDNALYVDGRLTLIDFEAAAYRNAAWEAAYLIVPWPTCWCSWALPADVSSRALRTWREILAPSAPAVTTDAFDKALARAVIAWSWISVNFLVPHAVSPPDRAARQGANAAVFHRPRPEPRALIQHRLKLTASFPTTELPALRDLAGQLYHECVKAWGAQELMLAPAFRAQPTT